MLALSHSQRRLWTFHQQEGPHAAYNVHVVLRLSGALDASALERALADVLGRHEVLRTVLRDTGDGPRQEILPEDAVGPLLTPLPCGTSRFEDLLRDGTALDPALAEVLDRPFDLNGDVLLRTWLIQLVADEHALVLVMHHAVHDGWSMGPLLRDLEAAYNARAAGGAPTWEPLPVQYADYTLWQQDLLGDENDPESVAGRQLAHWRAALKGIPEELALAYDRPRPVVPTYAVHGIAFGIAAGTHAALLDLARHSRATLSMVLQAAVAALLKGQGAGSDIPLGTDMSGRTDEALDDLVGFFVNTLVLRVDASGDPTFRDLVERVRDVCLSAYDHQDLPFEMLAEDLAPARTRARHPLFQTVVKLHNGDETQLPLRLAGLGCAREPVATTALRYDLAWDFVEVAGPAGNGAVGGSLTAHLTYATDLFDRRTAEGMRDGLIRLLDTVAADPESPVRHIHHHTEPRGER
ncbi:condensation domain-containing protein [Streptomyces sp. NPDC001832]|uniref:condensation domain-containing protein n=1 Tax=Streptomyces sp. NPDC001832 TaxID=3154527 RepID=UPI0033213ADC